MRNGKKGEGKHINTPDELIETVRESIKKQEANFLRPPP